MILKLVFSMIISTNGIQRKSTKTTLKITIFDDQMNKIIVLFPFQVSSPLTAQAWCGM